jgi:hypothetical protein
VGHTSGADGSLPLARVLKDAGAGGALHGPEVRTPAGAARSPTA